MPKGLQNYQLQPATTSYNIHTASFMAHIFWCLQLWSSINQGAHRVESRRFACGLVSLRPIPLLHACRHVEPGAARDTNTSITQLWQQDVQLMNSKNCLARNHPYLSLKVPTPHTWDWLSKSYVRGVGRLHSAQGLRNTQAHMIQTRPKPPNSGGSTHYVCLLLSYSQLFELQNISKDIKIYELKLWHISKQQCCRKSHPGVAPHSPSGPAIEWLPPNYWQKRRHRCRCSLISSTHHELSLCQLAIVCEELHLVCQGLMSHEIA